MLQELTLKEARRIALAAQGFGRPRPKGRVDARHIRRAIHELGLLQLDFANVLVPAHYLILFSRLGPYRRSSLDDLVYRRREFTEQWCHEASIVPMECWPLLRYRRESHRVRPWGFESFLEKHPDFAQLVLTAIRERGALRADDLPQPDTGPRRISTFWGSGLSVRRQVFEAHFGFGRLAVADRLPNFQRTYDLVERVVPAQHRKQGIDKTESQRRLLCRAARSLGLATAADVADYYRIPVLEARPRLAELVEDGLLHQVRVQNWKEPALIHPRARMPRRMAASTLLSPFDPVVWTRPRVARLFEFEYTIEIYVPPQKRKWGYYVLPFLHGDRLAARVDLKADRKKGRLLVPAAYVEPFAQPDDVAGALAVELRSLADWLELDSISVGRRGGLARALSAAVRETS